MADPNRHSSAEDERMLSRSVEVAIRIGLVVALMAWCFAILAPFVVPVVWAVIMAVAVHPAYRRLRSALGERRRLAAFLMVVLGMLLLLGPTALLGGTLVDGSQALAARLHGERLAVPPPPQSVRSWPLVGEEAYGFWKHAAENLREVLAPLRPQLVKLGTGLLSTAAGIGLALLQSLLAMAIAGVLLANAEGGGRVARAIGQRVAGERGAGFVELAGATVRSVAVGILGVALIQSSLAALGFLAVGIPGAGLWALLGLLLCAVQIGLLPLSLPAVIYVFATADTWVAVVFTVWTVLVSLLDNVLKPILLGRGVRVPTVVIFLGSIGGFLSAGIVGLFVGAVVLVLGYALFQAWLDLEVAAEALPGAEALPRAPGRGSDA